MNMKIKIITDSCCDLPLSFVEEHARNLLVLGMPVQVDGVEIIDDLGKSYTHKNFYEKLRQGIMPTTSQVNAYRFEEAFKTSIEQGFDVLYLGFSSAMSGTFNSANIARSIVLEDFPDAKIYLVDTLSASIGQGVLVVEALKRVELNHSIEDISNFIESIKLKTHHWFGVDDLNYLKNGGRISHVTAMVGNVLNVKPTLGLDSEGKLIPFGNVRGRKKSIAQLVSKFESHYCKLNASAIIVGHGNSPEDADYLKQMILTQAPTANVLVSELSMTIASHVGPDMIALAFVGDTREK